MQHRTGMVLDASQSRLPDPITVTLEPPSQRGQVTFYKEAAITEDDHLLRTLERAREKGWQGHKVCGFIRIDRCGCRSVLSPHTRPVTNWYEWPFLLLCVCGWLVELGQTGLDVAKWLPSIQLRSMGMDLKRTFLRRDGTITKIWSSRDVVMSNARSAQDTPLSVGAGLRLAAYAGKNIHKHVEAPQHAKSSRISTQAAIEEAHRVGALTKSMKENRMVVSQEVRM